MHKIRTEMKEGSLFDRKSWYKRVNQLKSVKNLSVSCRATKSALSKLLNFVRYSLYFEAISSPIC